MPEDFFPTFAAMLGDPTDTRVERWLIDPAHHARLAIYRNGVVSGAIEALRAAYPVVNTLTGPRFFSSLARQYWRDTPPDTRSLTLYGHRLADMIAEYEPARGLPYLPDVARLDRAWLEAHHADDEPAMTPQQVAALSPGEIAALVPGLHASVRLLELDWPVHALWQAHRSASPDALKSERWRLEPETQRVIVWRPSDTVRSQSLDISMTTFLRALAAGESLEAASLATFVAAPDFDPATAFASALSAGYLSGASVS